MKSGVNNLLVKAGTRAEVKAAKLASRKKEAFSEMIIVVGIIVVALIIFAVFKGGMNDTIIPAINNMIDNAGDLLGGLAG